MSSISSKVPKVNDFKGFKQILDNSNQIVALTGAGMSAESGIPTFRDKGGFWNTYRSVDLATPHAFRTRPGLVWEFYNYRRNIAFNALPNEGHKALASYEQLCKKQGRNLTIITQNVDGLHKKAGSEEVIELHGALRKVICTKCKSIEENYDNPICDAFKNGGNATELDKERTIEIKDLPKCKKSGCQGLIRPYIVWFGEDLDRTVLQNSSELIKTCDLCLVIGTSSVVYPAAAFAPLVAERGKPVAEFNINEEPADNTFEFHFPGKCGITLPKALGT